MSEVNNDEEFGEVVPFATARNLKIILIIFIGFLLLSFGLIFNYIKQTSQCLDNPFVYGAKSIKDSGLAVSCTCNILEPGYNSFNFNDEELFSTPDVSFSGDPIEIKHLNLSST